MVASPSSKAAPAHARLHYKGRLRVAARDPASTKWGDLVKDIRWWIGNRVERNPAFTGGKWIFIGGEWASPGGQAKVVTRCLSGDGDDVSPQFWALSFSHPCSEHQFRHWQTDVGITRVGEAYELSIAIRHWVEPGYFGDEPEPPQPSAPRIVHRLIDSDRWRVFLGSTELTLDPLPLREGDGMDLHVLLESAERECPLVLVAREFRTGEHLVDVQRLAKLLAGSALVYASEASGTDNELEWVFPKDFRCWNGMVRVYLPRVRFDRPQDARRHRFFRGDDIWEIGRQRVEDLIVEGLARRFPRARGLIVGSIADVEDRDRHQRFALLREQAESGEDAEWKALYDEEIERLERESKGLLDMSDDLHAQVEGLSADLNTAKYLEASARRQSEALTRQVEELSGLQRAVESIGLAPSSLLQAIETIEQIFGSRICFTDAAKQSAKAAGFNRARGDMPVAWKILWHMATTLHDMSFGDADAEGHFAEVFRQRTGGLDLTLTEGKQTKRDSKLRGLRLVEFEGQEIDITPHLKHGNDRKTCLRIHYAAVLCPDGRQLIVVGHCGDHLDTAGTRKLS